MCVTAGAAGAGRPCSRAWRKSDPRETNIHLSIRASTTGSS